MRDVHDRDPGLFPDLQKLPAHLGGKLRVQIRERFVEKQKPRLHDEGAGKRHPLLLSAGHLVGHAFFEARKMHETERFADLIRDGLPVQPADPERVGDVAEYIHVRPYRIGLEDHADIPLLGGQGRRHAGAVKEHVSVDHDPAGRGLRKTGDHPEQRRFAAAGRSDHGNEFPVADGERHLLYRRHRSEHFRQIIDHQFSHIDPFVP